jgi:putative YphP/YqiW family bacilliredoxin
LFVNTFYNNLYLKNMYPPELTLPLSKDLTDFGFEGLTSPSEVAEVLDKKEGTVLLVVNSVCGCAAANARPGAKMAIQGEKKPDKLVTVFAGVDREAVEVARDYLLPYPPSSPAIALFKDGKLVHMLERRHIEGNSARVIADNLVHAFDVYC